MTNTEKEIYRKSRIDLVEKLCEWVQDIANSANNSCYPCDHCPMGHKCSKGNNGFHTYFEQEKYE